MARQKPAVNAVSDALDHPPFIFNLGKFSPGALRAEGFINGQKVAQNIVRTPEKPAKLLLEYDLSSTPINKENPNVVFVYAKVIDEAGTVIPDAT